MGMLSKFFGTKNEPAADFDNNYDDIYYGNGNGEVGVEESDDVRVVLSEDIEEAPLLKRTFTPVVYEDASAIVEALKEGRVAVVCIEELDKSSFVRVFDYLMGALQALDGELRRVDRETVVLLPAGFDEDLSIDDIDEEIIEEAEEADEEDGDTVIED